MAGLNVIQLMRLAPRNDMELAYDQMVMPHWSNYLSPYDVEQLHKLAISKRLSGNMSEKLARIKEIMNARGFIKFAGGTNRVVYRHLEDTRFVAKIAIDRVGMSDNPAEFENQWFIRPYCAKMFQVTECGTVGFAERVLPITSKEEFKTAAEDIFEILYCKIIGKYIVEDVGTDYFMNFGIRPGAFPVLLDYPYVYELDGASIFCRNVLPNGAICGGEIDYDDGLNNLVCKRCGRKYLAREMKKNQRLNRIVINKGGSLPVNVKLIRGNEVIVQSNSSDYIAPAPSNPVRDRLVTESINAGIKPCLVKNGKVYTAIEQKENKAKANDPDGILKEIRKQARLNGRKYGTISEPNEPVMDDKKEPNDEPQFDIIKALDLAIKYLGDQSENVKALEMVKDSLLKKNGEVTESKETDSEEPVAKEEVENTKEVEIDNAEATDSYELVKEDSEPIQQDQTDADKEIRRDDNVDDKGRQVIGGKKFGVDSGFIPSGDEY